MPPPGRGLVVVALGSAQTLAWASTYYLPAMLAAPMARDLGLEVPTVFAAFSFALVISAFVGPQAGRWIDRWGARPVLVATSLLFAAGLLMLARSHGALGLFVAWAVLGIGMGSGLYEAAFAGLVRLYGRGARGAITGITLLAGFASTVGWPLSTWLEAQFGWRGACLGWAALHLLIGLPLNACLPRATAPGLDSEAEAGPLVEPASDSAALRASVLLSVVFAITWFISTAMAAHLPRLLMAGGATLAAAVACGALVGPAQVAARLLEFGWLRKVHPLLSARLATLLHPAGAALLGLVGAPAAAAFVILHGAGNGILTIAKGTLPLVLFGPQGYGHRQGLLMVPARIAQALAPWLFGICLDRWGAGALWLSALLGLVAFCALMVLRRGD
ncbi:MAG: MFS transporter [Comamonadaceae bacterium]|nr:MAG: MFS transporter [Comamonadaceae bacterium]